LQFNNAIGQPGQGLSIFNKGWYENAMSPQQMQARLESAFPDGQIEVRDMTGTEDHWEVLVRSSTFEGLSRVERHHKVMNVFAEELKSGEVHALSIRTETK
jgi:stress-induced morphogen